MTAELHHWHASEGLAGDVLEIALDPAFVFHLDGQIVSWNAAAGRVFGWSADEAVGRFLHPLIVPPRANVREHALLQLLTNGGGPLIDGPAEADLLHRNGMTLRMELAIGRIVYRELPLFIAFARAVRSADEIERQQALVIDELDHRLRNLLGIVSSIARQTVNASASLKDFLPAFQGRLTSLDIAYRLLTATAGDRGSLLALAQALLAPQQELSGCDVAIEGPDILLTRRQFVSLNMIMHELVTNAVKYGALSQSGGKVSLQWSTDGASPHANALALEWREDGVRPVVAPTRRGFGFQMIDLSARQGLHGTGAVEWLSHGLCYRLKFAVT